LRTMSPSSSVIGRPPICSSLTISTLARVDLPELRSPEKNTVKPWRERGGRLCRSSCSTSGNENHAGISRPKAGRSVCSAGDSVFPAAAPLTVSAATKVPLSGLQTTFRDAHELDPGFRVFY
jgi:hypothetical protein